MKRSGFIRRVSEKRLREAPARRKCVEAVKARDKVCQFWPKAEAYWRTYGLEAYQELRGLVPIPGCWGPLTAHEVAHRRNSDFTNPNDCIALCYAHNGWLEDHPQFGYDTGLLVRGNGLPLRKGLTRPTNDVS